MLLTTIQSSTAIGATWDVKLIETVGAKLLAPEAKLRAASVILAPTCNIQRVSSERCILEMSYSKKLESAGRKSMCSETVR